VLRPGGHLAVQELVGHAPEPSGRLVSHSRRVDRAVCAVGFVDLTVRDVTAHAHEPRALLTTARARLDSTLQEAARTDDVLTVAHRQRMALSACLATRSLGLRQILGRRP
jgi:hypothetical protein